MPLKYSMTRNKQNTEIFSLVYHQLAQKFIKVFDFYESKTNR